MINYKHKVSAEWMEARHEYQILTASDIPGRDGLVSPWKTLCGLSRKKLSLDIVNSIKEIPDFNDEPKKYIKFAKVWAKKKSTKEEDLYSYGPAALGHIREKYSVDQFNADHKFKFYHWDDCIIRDVNKGIGFSPDAMSIPQDKDCPVKLEVSEDMVPYDILEIKNYGEERYIGCCLTDKMEQEERFQIAAAMLTDKAIQNGTLYYFCPTLPDYCHEETYSRKDLELEIAIVEKILEAYNYVKQNMESKKQTGLIKTAEQMDREYLEEQTKMDNIVNTCNI